MNDSQNRMSDKNRKYVYGPVASRRLGRSLGVDLVPFKVCPFDCIYCQLGRTTVHTTQRREYQPTDELLAELGEVLARGAAADCVTLGGSGEPTLHSELERIVAAIKGMTDIPLAVLTNSALLSDPDVRKALARADLIAPSLDAGDEQTFIRINRPCTGVTFADVVEGLKALRREYAGRIQLEVLLVEGVNDSDDQIAALKAVIDRIRPDTIDLNTVTRPPAEADARPLTRAALERVRLILGPRAQVIASVAAAQATCGAVSAEDILAVVRRRPCTIDDLAAALGCHRLDAAKLVAGLEAKGAVTATRQDGRIYYQAKASGPDGQGGEHQEGMQHG